MNFAQPIYVPSNVSFSNSTFDYRGPDLLSADAQQLAQLGFAGVVPYHNLSNTSIQPGGTQQRRNSQANNTYPYSYPTSLHDGPRSPVKACFKMPAYPEEPSLSPTRGRFNHSSTRRRAGPDRISRLHDPRDESARPARSVVVPSVVGPSNHVCIPQVMFQEPACDRNNPHRHAPILFRRKGFPEYGIRVESLLKARLPAIESEEEPVLKNIPERELKVHIIWPGYSSHPFERRVKSLNGTISRASLLLKLAQVLEGFVQHLKSRKAIVECGYEEWAIGHGKKDKADSHPVSIDIYTLLIARLVHRSASQWQMELWAPKETMLLM